MSHTCHFGNVCKHIWQQIYDMGLHGLGIKLLASTLQIPASNKKLLRMVSVSFCIHLQHLVSDVNVVLYEEMILY